MTSFKHWRLIPFLEADGTLQMQIDRWLLEQHRLGKQPPTLRFYTWLPAAISLGYHQKDYPQHWNELTWKGQPLDLVRRPTGGRAVLHQGDLTYMVVISQIPGNREQVYQTICQFLIEGMRSLGIELDYGRSKRGYIGNPNCWAIATAADLIDDKGRKLIGSAQLRRGQAFLQHGSIFLTPNRELYKRVFNADCPIAKLARSQTTIIESLQKAARDCFEVDLILEALCDREWQEILAQPSL
ncbi:MAG: biotin/lipoate A/B protein ligase family protein [Prochloraceae cyanobacterium]|nr:biotin/lipoate A/B protein ligase family protein [Prochloraceae cyanobacterium]